MKVVIDPNAFDVAMTFMGCGVCIALAMAVFNLLEGLWPHDRNRRRPPPPSPDEPPTYN